METSQPLLICTLAVFVSGEIKSKPKMTDITGHRAAERTARHSAQYALLLGLAICGALWFLYTPYKQIYVPNSEDIPALADGLLLAPGARWQDWFTRGYS